MIYPKLEEFISALAVLYCADEIVFSMVNRAGIRFKTLPPCFGQEVGVKAQGFANFALARHELSSDIAMLDRMVSSFTEVPRDEITLQEKLARLVDDHRIFDICNLGLKDVTAARRQMVNLKETLSPSVNFGPLSVVMTTSLHEVREDVMTKGGVTEIKNFERLSRAIGGFNPGRIGLLLADTGFGKTNLGLQLALNARHRIPVAYVNMEMSFRDIAKRIAVLDTGVSYSEFYKKVKDDAWIDSFNNDGKGFFITDGKQLSTNQIKAWVRSLKQQNMFIVIDYDQCIVLDTSRDTPEWKALQNVLTELDEFSRDSEVNSFILVLAQLNRDGEISASHRATFKAHTVLHFKDHEEHGPVIVATKNRHGKKDDGVKVNYCDTNSKITELDQINVKPAKKTKRVISMENKKPANWYSRED